MVLKFNWLVLNLDECTFSLVLSFPAAADLLRALILCKPYRNLYVETNRHFKSSNKNLEKTMVQSMQNQNLSISCQLKYWETIDVNQETCTWKML